ncbi:hypothetical protein CVT24_007446 [Panaeolus cyanescens]|uniref:Chromatin elongation factor SPT5 n=1 Tax=Panaeolus cyanescens TaxID=181874 RepID=A0A409W4Y2_9AGAR|nr:hypothetical protein CVT24_007446 [Panaeolus cyanescens]
MVLIGRARNPFLDVEAYEDRDDGTDVFSSEDKLISEEDDEEVRDTGRDDATRTWREWSEFEDAEDAEEIQLFLNHLQTRQNTQEYVRLDSESGDQTSNAPKYPLYRVACKRGAEQNIAFHLLQSVRTERIASVIARPSTLGWVYIEGMLADEGAKDVLLKTPGIRRRQNRLILEGIEEPDWAKVLRVKKRKEEVEVGQWIEVGGAGRHKGDLAMVMSVETWGARVLVVQRAGSLADKFDLSRRNYEDGPERTRKRPSKETKPVHAPALFTEIELARRISETTPEFQFIQHGPHSFSVDHQQYEHGLFVTSLAGFMMKPAPLMTPSVIFHSFLCSNHPLVLSGRNSMPRPTEWSFIPEERIQITDTRSVGVVRDVQIHGLEVSLDGEGDFFFPWYRIRKIVKVGDFVKIIGGSSTGTIGWVVSVNKEVVHVVDKGGSAEEKIMHTEVHCNCVTMTVPPFSAVAETHATRSLIPRDFVPWLNTRVLITKKAWKGQEAVVQTVVKQGSKEYLTVRLETYNPNHPFANTNVEYDDVVEARSKLKLREYWSKRHLYVNPEPVLESSSSSIRASTPTPSLPPLSTPIHQHEGESPPSESAWDPNSATPLWTPSLEPPPPVVVPQVDHELLHTSLMGARCKVTVHGGGYSGSQMWARVAEHPDGYLGLIGTTPKNGEGWLEPQWVLPRRPTANRGDNGPMYVTKGLYRGLRVRRLGHRTETVEGRQVSIMRCVAVVCGDGLADTSTNLEVEVGPDEACLAYETPDEKKLNQQIVKQLRAQAKNTPSY